MTAWSWWNGKRVSYNFGLVISGILAFIAYCSIIWSNSDIIEDADITILTTLVQGVGYLFMMFVANICYCGGPIAELILKPKEIDMFRSKLFIFGFCFSVILPFSIPSLLLSLVIFYPEYWTKI